MVNLSRYAIAVLTASIALAGSASGSSDAALDKNLETTAPSTEVKAQKAAEEAAHRKRKALLFGAGIGSVLAVAVVFLGLKVLGTKMIHAKHEDTGKKIAEELLALTKKFTVVTEKLAMYIETRYQEGFLEAVQKLSPAEKAKHIDEAGKQLQAKIESKTADSLTVETVEICGMEVQFTLDVKVIILQQTPSLKPGEST